MVKTCSHDCEYSKDKDECIYNSAVKFNSQYGCEYIDEPVVKYECLAELTQEIKHCKMISDKNTRDYCCDKIVDDGARKECYGEEKKEEKEELSCDDNPKSLFRDSCWRGKAKDNCDTSICIKNFERDYDKNECIRDLAVECGVDYCLDMVDSNTFYNKVSCIYILAKDEKDCELIGGGEYESVLGGGEPENRETCLKRLREK